MHELSLAWEIQRLVALKAREHHTGRIREVRVVVGALSGVDPQALAFCYQALQPTGALAGSKLVIKTAPPKFGCRACGAETEGHRLPATCPACGGSELHLVAGTEFFIQDMEAED